MELSFFFFFFRMKDGKGSTLEKTNSLKTTSKDY